MTASATSLRHNRDYVLYRASRAISALGSQMSGLVYPLLVLSIGGSAVQAGAAGSCALLTRLACQIPAGHLADRLDQRRLMIIMDAVRLVSVGSVPLVALLGHVTYPHLLVVGVVEGAGSAVFGAAAGVYVRVAVPKEQFARAMSQAQASFGTTALLGPILGGALYGVARMLPFVADAASYLISGILLLPVRSHRPSGDNDDAEEPVDWRITAGMRWLWSHRDIMGMVLFGSALNLVGATMGLAAVVVMHTHGEPASVIGLVLAVGGCGMVAGSLIARRAVAWGPARVYVASGLIWAGSLASIAVSSSPWVVGAVFAVLSAIGPANGIMLFQILADEAPKSLYGRVSAAQALFGSSLSMAGPLLAGVLVVVFGGTYLWLVLGGICLVATIFVVRPTLAYRRRARDTAATAHLVAAAKGV